MSHLVAVYGSLLNGLGNHGYLRTARFIAHDEVGGLAMFDLGPFPACAGGRYTDRVKVEVYEVDDETLRGLDQLEGHPHFYTRDEFLTSGQRTVWLYIMSNKQRFADGRTPQVVSGDWRSHLAAKVGGHHA